MGDSLNQISKSQRGTRADYFLHYSYSNLSATSRSCNRDAVPQRQLLPPPAARHENTLTTTNYCYWQARRTASSGAFARTDPRAARRSCDPQR